MDQTLKRRLEKTALEIRIGILEQMESLGFGHVGGSLSIADLLAVLYDSVMKYDAANPLWPERDKVVCSKGHAGPALYSTLSLKGFFPHDELYTLNRPGTNLPSHCDRNKTPGIDMTTGSLGQGTSLAVGMAMGDKLMGRDSRTFLICGDGEINEGQVWEAAMFTGAKKVTNLMWFIDYNKKQLDGYTKDVLKNDNVEEKFAAFGFDAVTVDGNDIEALYEAVTAPLFDKPRAIIMDTVKGKGVPEIEESFGNHSMTLKADVWNGYLTALKNKLAELD